MTQEETGGKLTLHKTYWKAATLEMGGVARVARLMLGLMHFIFFYAITIVF